LTRAKPADPPPAWSEAGRPTTWVGRGHGTWPILLGDLTLKLADRAGSSTPAFWPDKGSNEGSPRCSYGLSSRVERVERVEGGEVGHEDRVELAGEVAFEAADEVFLVAAVGCQSGGHVGAGGFVPGQSGQHDAVEGGVGLSVSRPAEPVVLLFAAGGVEWGDAGEAGERG